MAVRYSGSLRITLVYVDAESQYRATLAWTEGPGRSRRKTVRVGPPRVLSRAVDSPQAYDEAAAAAISFANEEDPEIHDLAAWTDQGLYIGRSAERAWRP